MSENVRKLSDRKVGLRTFSFGMRSFLLFIAVVALIVLLVWELNQRFGAIAAAVSVFVALSVFAHVAGAAIGSRLRGSEYVTADLGDDQSLDTALVQPIRAQASDFAPATQLSQQEPLNRKPIVWAVGAGASFGALLAAFILTLVLWDDLAIANVLFGAGSAAVLGGLMGFWLSSFYQVARNALADAQKQK